MVGSLHSGIADAEILLRDDKEIAADKPSSHANTTGPVLYLQGLSHQPLGGQRRLDRDRRTHERGNAQRPQQMRCTFSGKHAWPWNTWDNSWSETLTIMTNSVFLHNCLYCVSSHHYIHDVVRIKAKGHTVKPCLPRLPHVGSDVLQNTHDAVADLCNLLLGQFGKRSPFFDLRKLWVSNLSSCLFNFKGASHLNFYYYMAFSLSLSYD